MARARETRRNTQGRIAVRPFRAGDGAGASAAMTAAFKTFIPAAHWKTILAGFAPERLEAASLSGGEWSVVYVATRDDEIVGYVSGSANVYGFGTLGVIGVDPRHLHRGIGTLLMRRMVTFWRRRGMRKVSTCVSAHNGRAFQFYLSHGFRPVGYQRDHFMVGVDEVILDRFFPSPRPGKG
jgi:ribosomal protein S18 acetylase RimI-like enzyme